MVDLKEQDDVEMKNRSRKSDYKNNEKKHDKVEVKKEVPVVSFDTFFQFLMKENPSKIFAHHKAAMKSYAKQKGLLTGTKKQFEDLFKSY